MRNMIVLAACFALSGIAPALAQEAAARIDDLHDHINDNGVMGH